MSACGEFAEHVWKPGSCKNCFHPRSAHCASGGSIVSCGALRASLGGEEEDGQAVTVPLLYSKPTIAVRPTMMHPDTSDLLADVNMNIEQVRTHQLKYRFVTMYAVAFYLTMY
uniref:Uncharacterized protein n=1 Tax=Hucho hucho TaxID=62062 RepID=A0A4W5LDE5_9TELE